VTGATTATSQSEISGGSHASRTTLVEAESEEPAHFSLMPWIGQQY